MIDLSRARVTSDISVTAFRADFRSRREREQEVVVVVVVVPRCRGGASVGAEDLEGNAFLWRRSGDSQDPSPHGDVGKSRSVLLPRSQRGATRVATSGIEEKGRRMDNGRADEAHDAGGQFPHEIDN